ncbi:hypothetical protein FGO68_gene10426 [Halteria grandinella]|uniref:Uncharacterized protein n=1 Tax=Halteria grandinella TaxID=5974 RepID=A0A8J8N9X0_HALGN|nr:hypothetical protein FGO68_gene10426 [Halteria grandinella]
MFRLRVNWVTRIAIHFSLPLQNLQPAQSSLSLLFCFSTGLKSSGLMKQVETQMNALTEYCFAQWLCFQEFLSLD